MNFRYHLRTKILAIMPWKWRRGKEIQELRNVLERNFGAEAFLFSSGREGLLVLLRSMNIQREDEIILQAYTCVVLPNAIKIAGATPIYVDIEQETLNMDPQVVEKAITSRTKLIICQHTFGIPSPLKELREICNRRGIPLLEDCAHIIPDTSGPEELGKYGDYLLLSFGRDKAISGIAGGAILSRNPAISSRMKEEEQHALERSYLFIFRLLCYTVYFAARPLYGLGLGRLFMFLWSKLGGLIPIVTPQEKDGHMSPMVHKIPNACASLILWQWKKLKELNDHRRMLTKFYLEALRPRVTLSGVEGSTHGSHEDVDSPWAIPTAITANLPLQKFPLFVKGADDIREKLKKHNIHLDDGWTGCVICPKESNLTSANYIPGSDPEAEAACEKILSLPTHPTMTMKQAKQLIRELEQCHSSSLLI